MEIGTRRLALRRFTLDDADFILRLVNDPDWPRNIGDRNVRTPDDARAVLEHAREPGLEKVLAVVSPGNVASIRLLEKIGMRVAGPVRLPRGGDAVLLYES